tara:strand:+ start:1213 stop:1455 length:243 start_codon:yes stop_codon:yes gene_type:complete
MSPSSSGKKKSAAPEDNKTGITDDGCAHHWIIEPPNGAVSQGSCKICGEQKEFRNSFEYSSWYGNKSPVAKGKGKESDEN